ncbi:MAG: tetratricopeptide repeat protein [Candidatus Xenobia bacterium]
MPRSLLLVLLLVPLMAGAAPRFKYVGHMFGDEPALQGLMATMPETWQHAMEQIHDVLGIPTTDRDAVEVDVDDIGLAPGHLGSTFFEGHPRIEMYILAVLEGRASLQEVVSHEATHALMRQQLGKPFEDMPLWLAEGLAVYASKAGPVRCRIMLMQARSPMMVLDGLESPNYTGYHYVEDYLALERLDHQYGDAVFKRFVADLMQGRTWQQAIPQETGEAPEVFVQRSFDYASAELNKLSSWTRPHQDQALAALRAHRFDDALKVYQAMLDTAGDASEWPMFYKGMCLFEMRKVDEARQLFSQVANSPWLAPEGMLYLGHCDAVEGHVEAALQEYEAIQARYPASYRVPAALYHAARLLTHRGRPQDAAVLLQTIQDRYPESVYAGHPPPRYEWQPEVNPHDLSNTGMLGF